MTTSPPVVAALPDTFNPSWHQLLRAALVGGYGLWLDAATDPATFDPTEPGGSVAPIIFWNKGIFWYDPLDSTTAADGVTCIVTSGGKRYKTVGVLTQYAVISATTTVPPGSPAFGDAYLVPAGASGAWATHQNAIAVWGGDAAWHYIAPTFGPPLYVKDTDSYLRWTNAGQWKAGLGSLLYAANTVPLSALINKGLVVSVVNQTQNFPPGARVTGAAPTVPLGGTAANINDNNTATTSTTNALGNLTAAPTASRIVAQLDLGSVKNLIAIELRQAHYGSSTATNLLYTSTDGTTWAPYGSGFSLNTAPGDVVRTGAVSARYVAFAPDQGNYGTDTVTLADLNAYDGTIVASVGDAYVIGPAPFGIFAGNTGKLAICEAANTFTIYAPGTGWKIYDQAQGNNFDWNGSAWVSSGGSVVGSRRVFTAASASPTLQNNVGTTLYVYSATTAPSLVASAAGAPYYIDAATLTYTAKKAGADLLFHYQAHSVWSSNDAPVVALFRDSETTALSWRGLGQLAADDVGAINVDFLISASDAAQHTYTLVLMRGSSGANLSSIDRRLFRVEEFS